MHTNDAAGAVTRLVDMGTEPFMVASTLEGIMAQRLVRVICPQCKTERPADDVPDELGNGFHLERQFLGQGCEHCGHTGYYGRNGIFEIMPVTDSIRELILARASAPDIKERARQAGMRTMYEDGIIKALSGLTTIEEVLRVTEDA